MNQSSLEEVVVVNLFFLFFILTVPTRIYKIDNSINYLSICFFSLSLCLSFFWNRYPINEHRCRIYKVRIMADPFRWTFPLFIQKKKFVLEDLSMIYLNRSNPMGGPGLFVDLCSIVMYCLIKREISWACSVWSLVIRCCIRLPHFMSKYKVPSSDFTLRVEITSEYG